MRPLIGGKLLLALACLAVGPACRAQQLLKPVQPAPVSIDFGVTFAGERSKPDPSLCCFWFKGGGVDAAMTLWKGFGVAATVTVDHASNYLTHTDENRVSLLAGPRYTFLAWKAHGRAENQRRIQLFGQGLVGVAHGFDTQFSNGENSANEFAFQTGGGMNFYLTQRFGIRPFDLEFVHTQIGSTGFSNQNDFRIGTGVIYHF